MEELQKDSTRLTDRGGKRTEELMRLEKMQKRVKKDLPVLTDKLRKRLIDWEKTGGCPNHANEGHSGVIIIIIIIQHRWKDLPVLTDKLRKRLIEWEKTGGCPNPGRESCSVGGRIFLTSGRSCPGKADPWRESCRGWG
jgi:hypothetical protein